MVIELSGVQFWSEIILVILNDFEITRMISDQIAPHSVQLLLYINGTDLYSSLNRRNVYKHELDTELDFSILHRIQNFVFSTIMLTCMLTIYTFCQLISVPATQSMCQTS